MSAYALFSEGELVEALNELKAELTASRQGNRYLSLSTGGKSFTRLVRSYSQILQELGDITQALQVKNPDTYGGATTKTYADGSAWQPK